MNEDYSSNTNSNSNNKNENENNSSHNDEYQTLTTIPSSSLSKENSIQTQYLCHTKSSLRRKPTVSSSTMISTELS